MLGTIRSHKAKRAEFIGDGTTVDASFSSLRRGTPGQVPRQLVAATLASEAACFG